MGRMPHVAWDTGWWTPNWPAILLIGIVGLILLAVVIAALTRKKPGAILPRVPVVDVFEEEQETMLVVELPGVSEAEISVEVNEEMVTVETTGARRYTKDIVLAEAVDDATIRKEYRDGLLTLRFARPAATAQPSTVGSASPATA
jgi:HSP20 family molecular chaperone IbpA